MKKAAFPLILSLGGILLTLRWIQLFHFESDYFLIWLLLFGAVAQCVSGLILTGTALMKKTLPLWLSIGLWYVFGITSLYVLWVCFCTILTILGIPLFPTQS